MKCRIFININPYTYTYKPKYTDRMWNKFQLFQWFLVSFRATAYPLMCSVTHILHILKVKYVIKKCVNTAF